MPYFFCAEFKLNFNSFGTYLTVWIQFSATAPHISHSHSHSRTHAWKITRKNTCVSGRCSESCRKSTPSHQHSCWRWHMFRPNTLTVVLKVTQKVCVRIISSHTHTHTNSLLYKTAAITTSITRLPFYFLFPCAVLWRWRDLSSSLWQPCEYHTCNLWKWNCSIFMQVLATKTPR